MLALNACNRLGYLFREEATPQTFPQTYEEVRVTAEFCRGKGQIISSGTLSGRLNFSFTTSRDSSFIQFTDLIGRKTLFLVLADSTIEAWDMRHNRRYDKTSIFLTLPFLEMTSPLDLRSILWGEIPPSLVADAAKEGPSLNGRIQIFSEPSDYGPRVSRVTFYGDVGREQAELTITKREFGSQYPHMKRTIPDSIPLLRLDT